jgi:apolipoprotein N-acyltransferase
MADSKLTWRAVRRWLLAALAGACLALALPGLCWWPLLLLFPCLLLASLNDGCGGRIAFFRGWLAGTVHWLIATSWVYAVMHDYGGLPVVAALICLLVMAIYLGFTWAVVTWVTSKVSPVLRVWLLPLVWAAIEAARQLPPYRFPWNPTAASLAEVSLALGSLPVWGATGLGWAIIAIGAGLWGLRALPTASQRLAALALPVLLTVLFTLAAPAPVPEGQPLVVAVLQPGTTLEESWSPSNARAIADRVWHLSRKAAQSRPRPELILWPESAVPYVLERDPAFQQMVVELAGELEADIVLNSIGFNPDGGYTNAAYLVHSTGISPTRYDKVRLVPFGEYVPILGRLAFTESLVREVASFTPGDSPRPLDAKVPIGVAICYEVVFADLVAAEVRNGSQVLTTITNDGWYGYSWAPQQHFLQSVLRAAESRRWLARAALTGVSGLIDPYGRIVARIEVGQSGYLFVEVQPTSGLTPRVRFGDWWGYLCAAAAIVLLVRARRTRSGSPAS